jgi:hypothetical protein
MLTFKKKPNFIDVFLVAGGEGGIKPSSGDNGWFGNGGQGG